MNIAETGAPYVSVDKVVTFTVRDGIMNLVFVRGVGNPKINAIHVRWIGAAPPL